MISETSQEGENVTSWIKLENPKILSLLSFPSWTFKQLYGGDHVKESLVPNMESSWDLVATRTFNWKLVLQNEDDHHPRQQPTQPCPEPPN